MNTSLVKANQKVKIFLSILSLSVICLYLSSNDGRTQTFFSYTGYLQSKQHKFQVERFRPRATCKCGLQQNLNETTFESTDQNTSHPLLHNSTCSPEATEAGNSQKVVSYTYYDGRRMRNYTRDIEDNLHLMRIFYPGWLLRVYSNKLPDKELCNLICENPRDFFFCPIKFADSFDIGKVSQEFQMQWRFLVLGDPTVDRFLVRDLDSRISEREANAVHDWEKSTLPFHGMRDHPWHVTPMMGGCWGGNNKLLGGAARGLQRYITMNREKRCCAVDQGALEIYVYTFNNSNSVMTHDSYFCNQFPDSVPFPTKRVNLTEYVGQSIELSEKQAPLEIVNECPEKCRPSFGKDWRYC